MDCVHVFFPIRRDRYVTEWFSYNTSPKSKFFLHRKLVYFDGFLQSLILGSQLLLLNHS